MSQQTPIDLSQLPAPEVVEPLDYEAILAEMLAHLRTLDPEFDALVESDPAYKILQAAAYRELLIRQRVNDAARAVMLAHATGADLEHLAALFGVARLPGESDTALRRRAQLAPAAYSTAGPRAAYLFHALGAVASWETADGSAWLQTVKDAAVYSHVPGTVTVAVLAAPEATDAEDPDPSAWGPTDGRAWGARIRRSGGYLSSESPQALAVEPLPASIAAGWTLWFTGGATLEVTATAAPGDTVLTGILTGSVADRETSGLLETVRAALSAETVRPLCDTVHVRSVEILPFAVSASLILRHGPDPDPVVAQARARVNAHLAERHAPGRAITRSGIIGALHVAGVHQVILHSPTADIPREAWQAAHCPPEAVTLNVTGTAD